MAKPDKSIIAKRITQGIGGFSFLLLIASVTLTMLNWLAFGERFEGEFDFVLIVFGTNGFASIVLALLILSRHPGHGVGRLFLAIGFFFSWFSISFAVGGMYGMDWAAIPALIRPFVMVGALLYLLPLMLAFGLVTLYFPDGQLPSSRWRPVLVIVWIGISGVTLSSGYFDLVGDIDIPWLYDASVESLFTLVGNISEFLFMLGILGSLASLVVRFIRSRGDERTQMKWLVYTAVMSISLVVLMSTFLGDENLVLAVFSSAVPTYLTVAIGIAILRHRLFDIDIIIRRTLQYAILTAILALVYFGGVVVLQNIFDALAGQHESPLITVISTLAIAALFNPLRIRLQAFIDKRFYRARYDSEQTLARFANTARDVVDIESLAAAMLGAVDETMQPERISLWLKQI